MAMSTATVPAYRFQAPDARTVLVMKPDSVRYRVTLADATPVAFTCPGFHYRGVCKHLGMVAEALGDPAVRLADEMIACETCGQRVRIGDAYTRHTAGGIRFLCDGCNEDLLLHAHQET